MRYLYYSSKMRDLKKNSWDSKVLGDMIYYHLFRTENINVILI